MNIQSLDNSELRHMVSKGDGRIITTSLKVAKFFNRQHKDVLRSINNLSCSSGFTKRNFAPSDYVDLSGRHLPMFEMTKDGFMFLVMGFRGGKAGRIKEAYIDAFNWMEEQLQQEAFSVTTELNAVSLVYSQAEMSASAYGKGLRLWRDTKSDLEHRISELKNLAQLPINFH